MITLLLLVILVVTTGTSAYVTYLVTDAVITEPLRERALTTLRATGNDTYDEQLADYHHRVQDALNANHAIPTDAPHPPEDPLAAQLLQCRWCAGLWVSVAVTLVARLALTGTYLPLWYGIPLHPLDLLLVPAWALTSAYVVGFLATREGD